MKLFRFLSEHILLILTLFLLAFIPLYPKLPLLDVKNTWVYVRAEDFLVAFAFIIYGIQLLRKKATLKTPLTIPIIAFWVVGAVSTISAIFLIFPALHDAYPTIGMLHWARRIEYLGLFFIAYSAMRSKAFAKPVIIVLAITLLLVVGYGLGQKGILVGEANRFPAYLTMNEEFAKGIPLQLSAMARIPSTFAGHYDLAAYLVMLISIMASVIFGFKNWGARLFFFFCAISGLSLLLLTASRVSFAVYLLTISFLLLIHNKKWFVIPVIILSIMYAQTFEGISQRFSSTISQVDLVVDARTGKAVGIAKQGTGELIIEEKQSTGETLPQGSGYINLPSQTTGKGSKVTYKRTQIKAGTESAQITNIEGNFVVKKVLAYDVSFTTRFQGEWPRAIEAFSRNILLGSGYSSISLATDNNYLRIIGEVGMLGILSFLSIFLVAGIYVKKVLPEVDSPFIKSLILGIMAGVFGLGLNAILIDVFEASKVAYVLWMLLGIAMGLLHLYQKQKINYLKEAKTVLVSLPAIVVYIIFLTFGFFWLSFQNFFMGDDFTWLKWAAECKKIVGANEIVECEPVKNIITSYFFNADGFFYRPGTKIYFFAMYAIFGLNAMIYHIVSVAVHCVAAILVFFLSLHFLKNKFFAFITAVFFAVLSVHGESVLWVAATGHVMGAALIFFSLLMYIYWTETKYLVLLVISILTALLSVFFHEFGIVTPLLIIFYDLVMRRSDLFRHPLRYWYYALYIAIVPLYLKLRAMASSHWFNGDYSYKLSNLPFNIPGNILGYIAITFFGSAALPFYTQTRMYGKDHVLYVVLVLVVVLFLFASLYYFVLRKIKHFPTQIVLFSLGFFVINLIPFLGLGNIATRYAYLPSFGLLLLFVYLLQLGYEKIARKQQIVASILLGIIILSFTYVNYRDLQRITADWHRSGLIANNLMKNFNDVFQVGRITPINPVFYFVNTPIRSGEAWVFPVGLDDALWFTFQNENLTVKKVPTLDVAFREAEGSASARVFEFDEKGNVSEVVKSLE